MKPIFRTTALAAALAACSSGSFAEVISLCFDDLGVGTTPSANPEEKGVKFNGAFAYTWGMSQSGNDPVPGVKPKDCQQPSTIVQTYGFLANRDRYYGDPTPFPNPGIINLSLTDEYQGQFIKSLNFDVYTTAEEGAVAKIVGYDRNNVSATIELSPGSALKLWTNSTEKSFGSLEVVRIEFNAGPALLGLDNMVITLSDASTGPQPAPEPASYALVGLALLAAGAATRRRA